jgi:hypothetical protein
MVQVAALTHVGLNLITLFEEGLIQKLYCVSQRSTLSASKNKVTTYIVCPKKNCIV